MKSLKIVKPESSPKSKSKIQVPNPSPKSKIQRKGTGTEADTIILLDPIDSKSSLVILKLEIILCSPFKVYWQKKGNLVFAFWLFHFPFMETKSDHCITSPMSRRPTQVCLPSFLPFMFKMNSYVSASVTEARSPSWFGALSMQYLSASNQFFLSLTNL